MVHLWPELADLLCSCGFLESGLNNVHRVDLLLNPSARCLDLAAFNFSFSTQIVILVLEQEVPNTCYS